MFGIFGNLLSTLVCGIALGYWLAPFWFKYIELIGIAVLIFLLALSAKELQEPQQNQENQDQKSWLSKLKENLFFTGMGLTMLSTFAGSSDGYHIFIRWLMVVCLWTTLSRAALKLSSFFNKFQLGFLLYAVAGISIGLGYLGSIYFDFEIQF